MIKLLTIIGARPQFIKAAALSRAIRGQFADQIQEVIVHTGQHYDENMSQVFFDEMEVPQPNYNLGVGSGIHGKQTAMMVERLEEVILNEQPTFVVLYGDTNSTLAGSIAAVKLHFPVIHIEAGLRSFNKLMPEEINRIVCDHTATLLFAPTITGVNNLEREGFSIENKPPFTINNPGVFHYGDVMLDNTLYFSEIAESKSNILDQLNLNRNNYLLATIHRDINTDQHERLNNVFASIQQIAAEHQQDIVIPLHPRTSKVLEINIGNKLFKDLHLNAHIKIIPPVSFFDMMVLEKNCFMIMTDSGGVQKEAYFNQKPVLILRSETEWIEIVENGSGIITDTDRDKIIKGFQYFQSKQNLDFKELFGNGNASKLICEEIIRSTR